MTNVSAADMFASQGCEHACSKVENKPIENRNMTASLIASAMTAGAVILSSRLNASAEETDNLEGQLEVSSVSENALSGEAPLPPAFNVENILGSAILEQNNNTEIASVNTVTLSAPGSVSSVEPAFLSEEGIPKNSITESQGVSDPSQTTQAFSSKALTEPANAQIKGTTIGSGPASTINGRDGVDGENGIDGQDGLDGINGQDGRDGIDGQNGLDGINGQDGRDGINGQDGRDGQTIFALDPSTLQNPDIVIALQNHGFEIQQTANGFGFVIASPDDIATITALLESSTTIQANEEDGEPAHGTAVISGNNTDDYLVGNTENNVINGFGGNDILVGGEGEDTLFGGEGNDTADYENSSSGININLKTNSIFGGDAEGDRLVSIENIIGTNAIDNIVGDENGNRLVGNDGDDTLIGNEGNDYIQGGKGADLIDGGEGTDLADYSNSQEGVNISLLFDTANEGDAEGDELNNIENLNGSRSFDTLEGDHHNNRLGGLSGDDELFGEGGNDTLIGGSGADLIDGGEGLDTSDYTASTQGVSVNLETGESLFGEAQGDTLESIENLAGSAFDDTLIGDDGINRLTGRDGNDELFGGGGNDRLIGGLGADHLDGGEGTRDTADYSAAEEAIGVDLEAVGFLGEADGDTYNNIEFVVGSDFHDIISGNEATNRISGGDGCDIISGRGGNDSLLGGLGDDVLNGGEGNDVFIFESNNGFDIIEDFEAGLGRTDRIDLRPLDDALFNTFEDVQSALTDTENGAVLSLDEGSILFQNIAVNDLVADDFILA